MPPVVRINNIRLELEQGQLSLKIRNIFLMGYDTQDLQEDIVGASAPKIPKNSLEKHLSEIT